MKIPAEAGFKWYSQREYRQEWGRLPVSVSGRGVRPVVHGFSGHLRPSVHKSVHKHGGHSSGGVESEPAQDQAGLAGVGASIVAAVHADEKIVQAVTIDVTDSRERTPGAVGAVLTPDVELEAGAG